ncbi:MarR family winged helix-turn-helix transcriptional regulator [Inediibacterium massiliense]|uniref:MarR family winged helix-turn-helix transcriptional regulator n=1 Tax=Inediibacterium massiliense TaxID=1658111 RepID=UPI0006B497C8|nr:MarR family transcriptional regulator [Inediibacterium massiliense]
MANYYPQINKMIDKLMHQVLIYDRKGFKIGNKLENLSLLDIHALRKIEERDDTKIYELVEELGVDRGVISSVIKKLMQNSYIIKEKSKEDKRVYILKLTTEGKEMCTKTMEIQKKLLNFVLEDMSFNEEKAILKFLSKINQTTLIKEQKNNNAL